MKLNVNNKLSLDKQFIYQMSKAVRKMHLENPYRPVFIR